MAQIVVIDDMPEMCLLFEDLLTARGHEVKTFLDAAPAIAEVDFSKTDLVITDLQMPTSGQWLIRTLRACDYQVPILVVSGSVTPMEFEGLMKMGADDVMNKPPDFKVFHETVERLLALEKAPRREKRIW